MGLFDSKKREEREAAIKQAEDDRDTLRKTTDQAIEKVDDLKDDYVDELTEQYRRANGGKG